MSVVRRPPATRGSVGKPGRPKASSALPVPSASGFLPASVLPQPKRPSRSDDPERAHVKPAAVGALVIQIKGKMRGNLEVPADADRATLEKLALESEIAAKWLEGKAPSRVIVVPGKLVNLVP